MEEVHVDECIKQTMSTKKIYFATTPGQGRGKSVYKDFTSLFSLSSVCVLLYAQVFFQESYERAKQF